MTAEAEALGGSEEDQNLQYSNWRRVSSPGKDTPGETYVIGSHEQGMGVLRSREKPGEEGSWEVVYEQVVPGPLEPATRSETDEDFKLYGLPRSGFCSETQANRYMEIMKDYGIERLLNRLGATHISNC